MSRIARISKSARDAEQARFAEAVDALIRGNSEESLDSLFARAGLDEGTRRAMLATLYERFGPAALTDDLDIARLAARKAVLSLLDTLVAKAGPTG